MHRWGPARRASRRCASTVATGEAVCEGPEAGRMCSRSPLRRMRSEEVALPRAFLRIRAADADGKMRPRHDPDPHRACPTLVTVLQGGSRRQSCRFPTRGVYLCGQLFQDAEPGCLLCRAPKFAV